MSWGRTRMWAPRTATIFTPEGVPPCSTHSAQTGCPSVLRLQQPDTVWLDSWGLPVGRSVMGLREVREAPGYRMRGGPRGWADGSLIPSETPRAVPGPLGALLATLSLPSACPSARAQCFPALWATTPNPTSLASPKTARTGKPESRAGETCIS